MNTLTQARLKELMHYDPETGIFTRLVRTSNTINVGDVAGSISKRGYVQFHLEGEIRLGHQLAWLYVYGVWPTRLIDHEDRDKTNNRIKNLREATRKQNSENSKMRIDNVSGFRGVSYKKSSGKWLAQIQHCGRNIYLGVYNTPEEASSAYETARDTLFTHHKKNKNDN